MPNSEVVPREVDARREYGQIGRRRWVEFNAGRDQRKVLQNKCISHIEISLMSSKP